MRRSIVVAALLCFPLVLRSQENTHIVSPGMTRAQVVEALGAPATQRTASEFTYMFYPNSCGRQCGMNDLVILKHDSVTDAIFRSPSRHYTGTSSSPEQATPEVAPHRARAATKPMAMPKPDSAKKAATSATPAPAKQMKPPAKPNDATPSIPAKQAPMTPAPAKSTAPAKTTAPAKSTAPDKKTPG
jgi:hypothetical protein